MKRIVICDSGLGGLNIAARYLNEKAECAVPCGIVYFNAYPSQETGFNKLPSLRAQEEVLRNVIEGMRRFEPERCLIACNTLSIVYERLRAWYSAPFPVHGIIDAAVGGMASALLNDAESSVLILGTKSTVESGVYATRLARQVSAARIRSLACPGLATLLESNPAAPEVRSRIADYARQSLKLWETPPKKLFLALCCTHFAYALHFWAAEFQRVFGDGIGIVNPNELMAADIRAESFSYHSRIDFFPGARESISGYFRKSAPAISEALLAAEPEKDLFVFEEAK